jgi:hypothetical protein
MYLRIGYHIQESKAPAFVINTEFLSENLVHQVVGFLLKLCVQAVGTSSNTRK